MAFQMSAMLRYARCKPELRNFTASGGRTGTGREQRVYRDAGFWEITFGEFRINDDASVLDYRAMMARLRQGDEIIARISDYSICETQGSTEVVSAAAARATTIEVAGVAADLQPGHHFSIGNRLHRVTEVTAQTEATVGAVTGFYDGDAWSDSDVWFDEPTVTSSIKFLPPLRAEVAANALVEFADLKCVCVLKDMADGDLDLDLGRLGSPSFTLIESI